MNQLAHLPVLCEELLQVVAPAPNQRWIDGTFGRGGHTRAFLERGCQVLALDRDAEAAESALPLLHTYPHQFYFQRKTFSEMRNACTTLGWTDVHGVLLDLGVSSPQFDNPMRGFSFRFDGPLDMRMDQEQSLTAAKLVSSLSEAELADLFYTLGDERESRRISRAIVRRRHESPLLRTSELAEVVAGSVSGSRRHGKIHPATKVFQALRMAVNSERDEMEKGIATAFDLLDNNGVLAVISFHSGEDRWVKNYLREGWRPTIEGTEPMFQKVERYLPSEAEIESNPRSRSARLRIGWKRGAGV